jgi:hypothetical protein
VKIFRNCTAETLAGKPYGRGIRGVNDAHIWGIGPFWARKNCSIALRLEQVPGLRDDFPPAFNAWGRALSTTKVVEAGLTPECFRSPGQFNIRTLPLDQDALAIVDAAADGSAGRRQSGDEVVVILSTSGEEMWLSHDSAHAQIKFRLS